ncbi:hypothetical protein EIP91_000689 [Steccherinum ochraceum]|uniref:Uncharacterized protein n=1 Tax=Steccherinum ochraceum TaxID=92696 RepID=A0A4R0RF96_9APHY|nr:hypothetical protein EIP91_000689 [Steccherinum ochraceum]
MSLLKWVLCNNSSKQSAAFGGVTKEVEEKREEVEEERIQVVEAEPMYPIIPSTFDEPDPMNVDTFGGQVIPLPSSSTSSPSILDEAFWADFSSPVPANSNPIGSFWDVFSNESSGPPYQTFGDVQASTVVEAGADAGAATTPPSPSVSLFGVTLRPLSRSSGTPSSPATSSSAVELAPPAEKPTVSHPSPQPFSTPASPPAATPLTSANPATNTAAVNAESPDMDAKKQARLDRNLAKLAEQQRLRAEAKARAPTRQVHTYADAFSVEDASSSPHGTQSSTSTKRRNPFDEYDTDDVENDPYAALDRAKRPRFTC